MPFAHHICRAQYQHPTTPFSIPVAQDELLNRSYTILIAHCRQHHFNRPLLFITKYPIPNAPPKKRNPAIHSQLPNLNCSLSCKLSNFNVNAKCPISIARPLSMTQCQLPELSVPKVKIQSCQRSTSQSHMIPTARSQVFNISCSK